MRCLKFGPDVRTIGIPDLNGSSENGGDGQQYHKLLNSRVLSVEVLDVPLQQNVVNREPANNVAALNPIVLDWLIR